MARSAATHDSNKKRMTYEADFKKQVVREALQRPKDNRIKPTCARYPGIEPCQLRKWIRSFEPEIAAAPPVKSKRAPATVNKASPRKKPKAPPPPPPRPPPLPPLAKPAPIPTVPEALCRRSGRTRKVKTMIDDDSDEGSESEDGGSGGRRPKQKEQQQQQHEEEDQELEQEELEDDDEEEEEDDDDEEEDEEDEDEDEEEAADKADNESMCGGTAESLSGGSELSAFGMPPVTPEITGLLLRGPNSTSPPPELGRGMRGMLRRTVTPNKHVPIMGRDTPQTKAIPGVGVGLVGLDSFNADPPPSPRFVTFTQLAGVGSLPVTGAPYAGQRFLSGRWEAAAESVNETPQLWFAEWLSEVASDEPWSPGC